MGSGVTGQTMRSFTFPMGLRLKILSLFLMAYSWIGYYNTRRAHTGKNLDGKTPIEYAKEVMPELNRDIALFPLVILDNLTTSSYWKSVNKVPTHYRDIKFSLPQVYEFYKLTLYFFINLDKINPAR